MTTTKKFRTERARLMAEARRRRRAERLPPNAACTFCQEPDLDLLMYPYDSVLDQHHVLGRNHAPEITTPLCRNCHAKEHATLADEGVDLKKQPSHLERVREALHALALFLKALADWLLKNAVAALDRLFDLLNQHLPNWREIWRALWPTS